MNNSWPTNLFKNSEKQAWNISKFNTFLLKKSQSQVCWRLKNWTKLFY